MPPKRPNAKKKPVKKATTPSPPSLSSAELERVLQCMLAPDTAQITHATNILNEFLKHPSSVAAFMHQITTSPHTEARQMSAVLLRRKIRRLWTGVDNQLKQQIQDALLQRLVNEPVRVVRRAVAALVSKIAQESIPRNKWPALLDFLSQCCHSQFSEHREIGVMLFRALAENIPRQLVPHVSTVQQLFVNGVNDPHPRVRIESLYALDALCELLTRYDHEKLSQLINIIPPLVNLVQQFTHSTSNSTHNDQDDEIVSVVFEVFDTIVDSPAPIPDSHLSILLPMILTVSTSAHYDINLREQACGFIINFVISHSKKLIKLGMVDMLLQAVFLLLCENKDIKDLQVLYEDGPSSLGVDLLNSIMENVPKTYTFNTVINTASRFMTDTAATSQKAGLIILAVICEFCHQEMLPQLSLLVQAVSSFINHPTVLVRVAAWLAFAQFCEHLVPDLLAYHRTLLPLIMQTLSNAQEHEAVRDKACVALEVFCENLDQQDIRPYLYDIMTQLVALLQTGLVTVQSSSLSAMNSVVEAAKKDFLPFFDVTIKLLAQMMTLTSDDEDLLRLRGRATSCAGYVAAAVGKETFNPHLSTFLPLVFSGMAMDSFYLRETSYIFFSNLADMLQEDFAPLLSTVLPLVLASLKSDDGVELMKRGGGLSEDDDERDAYGSELEDVDENDDDDDDEELIGGSVNLQIRTGAKDEKVSALGCLATIFACVSQPLIPYVDTCYAEIKDLIYYPHSEIRSACVTVLHELVHWHHRVYDPEVTWTRGQVNTMITLTEKHQAALNNILPEIISLLEDEDDRETVHACMDVLDSIIRLYGMMALQIGEKKEEKEEQIGERLHEILMLMLQEKHPSQQPDEATDDDSSSASSSSSSSSSSQQQQQQVEQASSSSSSSSSVSSAVIQETKEIIVDREEIFEYVTDLIETLTKVCGALYVPRLQKQLPLLIKFTRAERVAGMRGTAVGCLGGFATELKADFEPFIPTVFPVIMAGLADPELSVRRNAAFAIGSLLQIPGNTLLNQYSTIIQALKQIYSQVDTAQQQQHDTANTSNGVSPSSASPLVADSSHVSSMMEELLACRDNACAAFAKMITALIERGLSASTPFFTELIQYLIAGLPAQSDHQESIYTYPCIISLYKHHVALIARCTPQVISIFSQVFGNPEVDATVQTDMIAFCRALLQSDNTAAVQQVVASLPERQQQQFHKFVIQGQTTVASAATTAMNGHMNGLSH